MHMHTVSILKSSLKLRSFVVEEVALADLLHRAWKPVGKKIQKQLSSAIDFKKGLVSSSHALNIGLWLTDDMYNASIEKQWQGIEKQVEAYLQKTYRRAWREKGRDPLVVYKQATPQEDDWDELFADFDTEGARTEEKESKAAQAAMIGALLGLIKSSFTSYAETMVVPSVRESLGAFQTANIAEKEILGAISQAGRLLEMATANNDVTNIRAAKNLLSKAKKDTVALEKLRAYLLENLTGILDGAKHIGGTANLTVARVHHFGFLDWAVANSVTYYKVTSVLDNKTCESCLEMNGKIFAVSDALKFREKYLSILDDKELLKQEAPFITHATAKTTQGFVVKKGEGVFFFPPFHPHCRCTLVAVHEEVVLDWPHTPDPAFADN